MRLCWLNLESNRCIEVQMGKTRSNDHTGVAAICCDPVRTEKHGSNNCIIRVRSADIRSQNYDS